MQHDAFYLPTVAIVGVGLIGGSLAAALKKARAVGRILGVGRQADELEKARALGLIDEAVTIEQAAARADLLVLATPIGAIVDGLEQMHAHLLPHTVVTDVGSTKLEITRQARLALGAAYPRFVPAHPVAGAEKTGPAAADADLFQQRNIILTPTPETQSTAQKLVRDMWLACGARVLTMSPAEHDELLASVSHVPHFLSSVYMWQVASADNADLRLRLAGSGFRDFTRIAAGSAEVWRDIFFSNKAAILQELTQVQNAFQQAESALRNEDEQALFDFLEKAALARRLWASRSGHHE